jgi:hypothetical protein
LLSDTVPARNTSLGLVLRTDGHFASGMPVAVCRGVVKPSLLFACILGTATVGCPGLVRPENDTDCPDSAPTCIELGGPCGAATTVDPVCDSATKTWSCPGRSSSYARTVDTPPICRPFYEAGGPIAQMRGALPRVPLVDGRCLWIGENVVTARGQTLSNVGFLTDASPSYGTCPTSPTLAGGSLVSDVTIEGPADPSLIVQIAGGYVLGGQTRVLYRLFQTDPGAAFGVTELGAGIGRWDAGSQQVVVPGASGLLWGPDIDLGDSSLVADGAAYVWGCHGPFENLTDGCLLARLDESDDTLLYAGHGRWVAETDSASAATVFQSSSWFSSVVPATGGGFEHVYVVAWGTTLQTQTAPALEGPWADGPDLSPCDVPASDSQAFCTGPVVHEELQDPTRPGETVVSYSVATLASNQGQLYASHPDEYWPRLAWVSP